MCCGLFQKLKLEPEELIIEGGTCLGSFDRKREYANLGFVKRNKICVCCRQVTWESTVIMPGCPCCNKKMTLEIAAALRERMLRRGTIGQLTKQSALVPQLEEALRALNAVAAKPGEANDGAPVAQTIQDRVLATHADEEHDMTNHCESALGCCLTCGVRLYQISNWVGLLIH